MADSLPRIQWHVALKECCMRSDGQSFGKTHRRIMLSWGEAGESLRKVDLKYVWSRKREEVRVVLGEIIGRTDSEIT